jgi:hypothetical protein
MRLEQRQRLPREMRWRLDERIVDQATVRRVTECSGGSKSKRHIFKYADLYSCFPRSHSYSHLVCLFLSIPSLPVSLYC